MMKKECEVSAIETDDGGDFEVDDDSGIERKGEREDITRQTASNRLEKM
jgi:hypothetical protein